MALKKLKFKDKLVQKGTSLQTNELLRRLQSLHKEISELDQDSIDGNSLHGVAKQLLDKSLLLHKDKQVKALVASSFIDILRLCAPDAPYTLSELKDIFSFIFRQLGNLWKVPKGSKQSDIQCYQDYYYLMRTMADVSCVVLVCDLPNAEEFISDIFKQFINGIRPDTTSRLQSFMAEILSQLIDECQALSNEILEIILRQFEDKNSKLNPKAHNLVVEVCNKTSDRLQISVCQYFTEILLQASNGGYSDEEFEDIIVAHRLIRVIHKHCPKLLLSTIAQLEAELNVEDVRLRELATKVLGRMFGDLITPSGGFEGTSLARSHPQAWRTWLNRRLDKQPNIRIAVIEACSLIITNYPYLSRDVIELIHSKLSDIDDKVRASACQFFQKITYEIALDYTPKQTLEELALRCQDRKSNVRHEAFESIGKLYNFAYDDIKSGINNTLQQFSWMPKAIMSPIRILLDKEYKIIRKQIETCLMKYILPINNDIANNEPIWVDRLLIVLDALSKDEKKALLALSGLGNFTIRQLSTNYLDTCEAYNGGNVNGDKNEITERLLVITKTISNNFPENFKAFNDLQAFAKLNESRLYKCLRVAIDPQQCDIKTFLKSQMELQRRLEQVSSNNSTISETFNSIIIKSSYPFVNRSSVPQLLKRITSGNSARQSETAGEIILGMGKFSPSMLKPHINEIIKHINEEKDENLIEICLIALGEVFKNDTSCASTDNRFLERIKNYVIEGTRKQCKYATRILAFTTVGKGINDGISREVLTEVERHDDHMLMRVMAFINELAKSSPKQVEQYADNIMVFILNDLMHRDHPQLSEEIDKELEWAQESELDHLTIAKMDGMKFCAMYALSQAKSDENEDKAIEIAKMSSEMYCKVLLRKGDINNDIKIEESPLHPCIRSRLRLKALHCMIKLASIPSFEKEITRHHFLLLSIFIQDVCYYVRRGFLDKIIRNTFNQSIPSNYNVIPFMTIHDVDADIVSTAGTYINSVFRKLNQDARLQSFELIFYRLLHTIAHHPDFSIHPQDISATSKYIIFYLDTISTSENINMLYHIAAKLKTVRDATTPENSKNLYIVSELAQHITRQVANLRKWNLGSYNGKIKLPNDIFRPLPSAEIQREIAAKEYLTNEMLTIVDGHKTKPKALPKKKQLTDSEPNTRKNVTKKRQRVKRKPSWEEEDEEDEEDLDDGLDNESDNGMDEDDNNDNEDENYPDRRKGPSRQAKVRQRNDAIASPTKRIRVDNTDDDDDN